MPLISADNDLLLWAFLMIAATAAIWIEHNVRWASKVPGAVIALVIAIAASNFGLIPTEAPVWDAVWGYIVPLAIPLLLFQLDLHALFKESWRLLLIFLISSVGTVTGTVAAFALLHRHIPELDKISGMMSASYTGGGVNFAAMTAKLEPSQSMTAAAIVADNLMMACFFFVLIGVSSLRWVRKVWGSPHQDEADLGGTKGSAADYWQAKPISLQNIAVSLASSIFLVALSFSLSKVLKAAIGDTSGSGVFQEMLFSLITDKYLLLTTFTLIAVFLLGKRKNAFNGSQELGMYCIYLFFVVIGIPASIPMIVKNAPLLFAFTSAIALINLLITMVVGKLFKFSIEEIVLACNANIGGPTTAAALAIGKGWKNLIGPILIVGTVGYITGNYIGEFVYAIVRSIGG